VAGGDVPHDSPFIVEIRPGTAACSHFEDNATEGPNVNAAVAATIATGDN